MAEEIVAKLLQYQVSRVGSVLEIGCGSGVLTERFFKNFQADRFYANDLVEDCEDMASEIARQYSPEHVSFIGGDIERIATELPVNLDLIVSNATFQWLDDPESFLSELNTHMTPGGIMAFSTFGPQNFMEIRHLTGKSLTYLSCSELRTLLEKQFQVITCSEECLQLLFGSPRRVLTHLRLTGVNGVSKQAWTKSDLKTFERRYREEFGQNGEVPLTYHPIICLVKNTR